MSTIGIRRKIDKTGRLCIPKEMRDLLKLERKVEIFLTEDGVFVRNPDYVLPKTQKATNRF